MSGVDLDARKGLRTVAASPEADSFKPYPHQTLAWDHLTRWYEQHQAGMLVVPTGGGKTAIAARWLLEHRISKGWRVLWFAQLESLLWQAAATFERAAHLSGMPALTRAVVSGKGISWSTVPSDCHVALSGIQKAGSEGAMDFIDTFVHQGNSKVFVVVDEAHHAAASTYQRVLGHLKAAGLPLLGLSATPTRVDDDEKKRLWNLFENPIYSISKSELIQRNILATPVPENVATKIEFDTELDTVDITHLQKYGDLAPQLLQRIRTNSSRNELIVRHYCENKEKYGKTIVFAIDIPHAITLDHEFRRQGIVSDYVSHERGNNSAVLDAYRNRQSDPQVLINVMMLTEGVDAPCTRTVFLTRPTKSEVLLQQMIGRALRGPDAGGNDTAYLVTFVDTWKNFSVLDAQYVVERGDVEPADPAARLPQTLVAIELELIREVYELVRSHVRGQFLTTYQCLPARWMSWDVEFESDIQRRHVLVFENQAAGWAALEEAHGAGGFGEPSEDLARTLVNRFFAETPDPMPKWLDVLDWLTARASGSEITSYTFSEKQAFDPRTIAKSIWDQDLGERKKVEFIRAIFDDDPVCRYVYRTDFEAFREDVQRALDQLASPRDSAALIPQSVPREPRLLRRRRPEEQPVDLTAVARTVCEKPQHFPRGEPSISDISFSPKPLPNLFGFYRYYDRKVVISAVLDSPDVPQFVMEFLVYHELLHADMPGSGHDRNFRDRERRFVPSIGALEQAQSLGITPAAGEGAWRALADQFLDTLDVGANVKAY